MTRVASPTDPSDADVACLALLLPPPTPRGRPREHPVREVPDARFEPVRAGRRRRPSPREFPPWRTVSHRFHRFRR